MSLTRVPKKIYKRTLELSDSISSISFSSKASSSAYYSLERSKQYKIGTFDNKSTVTEAMHKEIFRNLPKKHILPFLKSGLSFEDLLDIFPARVLANLLSFFSALFYFQICQDHILKRRDRGNYSSINARFLRHKLTILGRDLHSSFIILEKLGYIVVDPKYKVGHYSMAYRLGPKFDNAKWEKTDFGKYLGEFCPLLSKDNQKHEVYFLLWRRFNYYRNSYLRMPEGKLKEILKRAHEIIQKIRMVSENDGILLEDVKKTCAKTAFEAHEELIFEHNRKNKKHNLNLEMTEFDVLKTYNNTEYVYNNQLSTVKVHDHKIKGTGRIFTIVTNTKKELRQFLRLDGSKLVNLDIRCSQPCLLAKFYQPEDQTEKDLFVSYMRKEDLYSALSKGTSMSRSQAKSIMFVIMFAENYLVPIIGGEIYERFEKLFPILSKRIFDIKKDDYKRAAFEMQCQESEIMISGAFHRLAVEMNIDCATIHDSIMVLPKDIDIARQIIEEEFFKAMGFIPVVRAD